MGVGQIEYGWQQAMAGRGARDVAAGVLYKMGLFCNFEFRAYFTPWQSESAAGQSAVRGIGDTWLTGQYRIHSQSAYLPALALHYTLKEPTANSQNGLGSGQRDHIIAVSAGKDFEKTSFNFETKYVLFGQPANESLSPFSRHFEYSLNATHALARHLSLTAEFYAESRSNMGDPALASTLWSIGYSPNPRLVFDTGIDLGLTHGAPDRRVFAGITYALGDLYKSLRHPRPSSD